MVYNVPWVHPDRQTDRQADRQTDRQTNPNFYLLVRMRQTNHTCVSKKQVEIRVGLSVLSNVDFISQIEGHIIWLSAKILIKIRNLSTDIATGISIWIFLPAAHEL